MEVYTTIQGDCWDLMAYKLYGDEKYMKLLYESNWEYADVMIFSAGVEILVPDIPEEVDKDAPFWRQETAEPSYSEIEAGDTG